MHHHTQLTCAFFVKTGICHVAQVGLKLLGSIDPPTLGPKGLGLPGPLPVFSWAICHSIIEFKGYVHILNTSTLSNISFASIFSHSVTWLLTFFLFFLLRRNFARYLGWSEMARYRLTATSASWVQAILLPQPPELLGLQVPTTTPG